MHNIRVNARGPGLESRLHHLPFIKKIFTGPELESHLHHLPFIKKKKQGLGGSIYTVLPLEKKKNYFHDPDPIYPGQATLP